MVEYFLHSVFRYYAKASGFFILFFFILFQHLFFYMEKTWKVNYFGEELSRTLAASPLNEQNKKN